MTKSEAIDRLERNAVCYAASIQCDAKMQAREVQQHPTTFKRRRAYRDADHAQAVHYGQLHATCEALHMLTGLDTYRLMGAARRCARYALTGSWD